MTKYFYDSYAILAFVFGVPVYEKYFVNSSGITTYYNLLEVYYRLLSTNGQEKADEVLERFIPHVIWPTFQDVKPAMQFRLENKNKRLSYADCLGYILARKYKVKFLTGDEGFNGRINVEFVKVN